ncbi:MAG: hypothetical protein WBL20_04215 [Sphingobium sp.]|uniref:hypothetical protein n=1 Tax=Sphingobium sp. TaxID=1912891 RepID=UPI002E1CC48C
MFGDKSIAQGGIAIEQIPLHPGIDTPSVAWKDRDIGVERQEIIATTLAGIVDCVDAEGGVDIDSVADAIGSGQPRACDGDDISIAIERVERGIGQSRADAASTMIAETRRLAALSKAARQLKI